MIIDINEKKILEKNSLNSLFSSANLKEINKSCKILNGDFYLDSFNYYPVTKELETFSFLFKRQDDNSIDHFYTKEFSDNFAEKKNNFRSIKNSFILGSSPADNYFTNLIFFFPRIFFTNEKKINIVIHRNSSNKFRELITSICKMREIDLKFNFIDDGFYKFENCSIPQFLTINQSIEIIKFFLNTILINVDAPKFRPKIYIRREDASYRKIINEADLIKILRNNDFEIINPQHFPILTQMKIFSNAELVISPHGSNLTNIICCKEGTKIIEIAPKFEKDYEKNISNRYKLISKNINLDFNRIIADTVDVKQYSDLSKKYIHKKVLYESDYYKNMILKVSEIEKLINTL